MTFVQYARTRRKGMAFKEIKGGNKVIEQQLNSGYQSSSGFNDALNYGESIQKRCSKNSVCFIYFNAYWSDD